MVVLFHLAGMEKEFGGGELLLPRLAGSGRAGVDLFFVVSGFIMVTVTAGAGRGLRSAGDFLYHRATRIYPVYWFYTAVLIGLHALIPAAFDPARWNSVSIARSLLLLPQQGLPVLVVGWTMVHEIYFYLVFALFLLAPERGRPWLLGAWLAALVALPAMFPGFAAAKTAPAFELITHPLTVEFIAGAAIGVLVRRGLFVPGRTVFAAGALLLLVCHAGLAPQDGAWPEGWSRVLFFGVPAALLLYGAVSMEFAGGRLLPRALGTIGDASYSIYLVQIFPLLALGRAWSLVRVPGLADNAVALALTGCAIVAAGLLSYRMLERPSLAFARRLLVYDSRGRLC
jgi:peptidoglycan/LPS O-acetylase OafA/YrhL